MKKKKAPEPIPIQIALPPAKEVNNDALLRKSFWSLIVAMAACLFIVGYNSGYHSDELDMMAYGKANINFYTSGGSDTGYRHVVLEDGIVLPAIMKYYGAGFEYPAAFLSKITGVADGYEINVRHLLNQLLAIIGLIFAGLLARRFCGNYTAAIIAVLLLFFTPFFTGLAIFDIKDVPFLAGYIVSTYLMVAFLDNVYKPRWGITILLMLVLGFSLSVRVVGIMLVIIFVGSLFAKLLLLRKEKLPAKKIVAHAAIAIAGAFLLMIVSWPFLLENPIQNIIAAINVAKDFPQKIPFNFEGVQVNSLELPAGYVFKSIAITVPIVVIIAIVVALFSLLLRARSVRLTWLFVLAASLLPLLYVHFSGSPLYNNWRHLLFIYPGIIAVASSEISDLIKNKNSKVVTYIVSGILIIGLLSPAIWMLRSGKYMYMYYNEVVGGFKGARYNYETDFWQMSIVDALEQIDKTQFSKQADSTIILTNGYSVSNYYFSKKEKGLRVKVFRGAVRSFNMYQWDYAVLSNLFLEPEFLEYKFPPVFCNSFNVSVADVPLAAVLRDTLPERDLAILASRKDQFVKADSLLRSYMQKLQIDLLNTDKDYMGLEGFVAFNRYASGRNMEEGLKIAQNYLREHPADYFCNLIVGVHYYNMNDGEKARVYLTNARNINANDKMANRLLDNIKFVETK